jgi:uncharacterized protein HemX
MRESEKSFTRLPLGDREGGHQPRLRPSRWPALLAFLTLAAVLALVGVGQYYWRGMQGQFAHLRLVIDRARTQQGVLEHQMEHALQVFAEQGCLLREQEATIRSQREALAVERRSMRDEHERLARQQEAVRRILDDLKAEAGGSDRDPAAEDSLSPRGSARSRMAQERDAETALEAMRSADERLREAGVARSLPVADRPGGETERRDEVWRPDRRGMSESLEHLSAGVMQLPLARLASGRSAGSGAAPDGHAAERWYTNASLWDARQGLRIAARAHRGESPRARVLTPDRRYAAYHSLRVQLDAARFGLLHGDPELYAGSLEAAERLLQRNFDTEAPETSLYLNEIEELLLAARAGPETPPRVAALVGEHSGPMEPTAP